MRFIDVHSDAVSARIRADSLVAVVRTGYPDSHNIVEIHYGSARESKVVTIKVEDQQKAMNLVESIMDQVESRTPEPLSRKESPRNLLTTLDNLLK